MTYSNNDFAQHEIELRRGFQKAIQARGIPRADARRVAKQAAADAVKIVRRFGPRAIDLVMFASPGGLSFTLTYSGADLNGSQRDIAETMENETFERFIQCMAEGVASERPA